MEIPFSTHNLISPGETPMYPNVTIPSMLMAGMRNTSEPSIEMTTFNPSFEMYEFGVVIYNVLRSFLIKHIFNIR